MTEREPSGNKSDGDSSDTSASPERVTEVRQKSKHRTYEPTDPWWKPPLSAWIQDTNHEILLFLLMYNVAVVLLARFTGFCGINTSENVDLTNNFCADDWILIEDKVTASLGVGMFLLLAFRANQAYDRFWEGRKMWGRTREVSRDFARLVSFHVRCETPAEMEDRRRAIGFCAAFSISLKLHLRNERDIQQDLTNGPIGDRIQLCKQDIVNIQKAHHMPQFCQDQLSYYLAQQQRAGNLSDYQLGVITSTTLSIMSNTLGACERIRNAPIPLSYVLQLRFFLILWLMLLPMHMVAIYGWWTILFCSLLTFAVLGVESMACEIENPFGYDRNDLNLDTMVEGITIDIHDILNRAEQIHHDQLFDRQTVEAMSANAVNHSVKQQEAV